MLENIKIKGSFKIMQVLMHHDLPIEIRIPLEEANIEERKGSLISGVLHEGDGDHIETMGVFLRFGEQGDRVLVVGERVFRVDTIRSLLDRDHSKIPSPIDCEELPTTEAKVILSLLEVKGD